MGKRSKSTRAPTKKKKQPLPQNFQCLFCNHETSVSVRLDRKAGVGSLSCKVCGQNYSTNINFLSEGVDVYTDWIDACDAVAEGKAPAAEATEARPNRGPGRDKTPPEPKAGVEDRYEGDDFVIDDGDGGDSDNAFRAGGDDDDD